MTVCSWTNWAFLPSDVLSTDYTTFRLHTRTKEGMMRAKEAGHIAGRRTGSRVETRKAISAKETIRKHNKSFGGSLSNEETWRLAGISKISFYKYKKEILDGCDSGKIHN